MRASAKDRSMAAVWSPEPSATAGVPSKRTFAARVPSWVRYAVRVSPEASPCTRNRPVPPSTTALTTRTSARAPLGTGSLTPVSVQPSPLRVAVTPSADALQRVRGSAWAKTAIVVPSEMPPRISPFCCAVPTAETRPPARTTVSMKGSGASTRPISSATIATSTGPAPMPPSSSSKFTVVSQPQDRAGDDGALHLVGASVDGDLAVVQVVRRRGARPVGHLGALAGERGHRQRAGDVDDQLGRGLLQLGAAELEHRGRRVRLAVGGVRDHPQGGELEGHQVVLQLGDPRGHERVLGERAAADGDRAGVLLGLGQQPLGRAHPGDADTLVAEQELRVVPAPVLLADQV